MRKTNFKYQLLSCLLFSVGFFMSGTHAAQPQPMGDLSLPIQIQSDQASFEHALKKATHTGNVVMVQGTNELYAEKLIMKKDLQGDVLVATGNPATFKGVMADDPAPITGTAEKITYFPAKKLLVLEGNATLHHQQDKFKGPSLSYQLDKQLVTATANRHERPTIVIQPRQQK